MRLIVWVIHVTAGAGAEDANDEGQADGELENALQPPAVQRQPSHATPTSPQQSPMQQPSQPEGPAASESDNFQSLGMTSAMHLLRPYHLHPLFLQGCQSAKD